MPDIRQEARQANPAHTTAKPPLAHGPITHRCPPAATSTATSPQPANNGPVPTASTAINPARPIGTANLQTPRSPANNHQPPARTGQDRTAMKAAPRVTWQTLLL
jgi:hypothetical protein